MSLTTWDGQPCTLPLTKAIKLLLLLWWLVAQIQRPGPLGCVQVCQRTQLQQMQQRVQVTWAWLPYSRRPQRPRHPHPSQYCPLPLPQALPPSMLHLRQTPGPIMDLTIAGASAPSIYKRRRTLPWWDYRRR
uniref:Secreted protein n=1 Tax=Heterosigma akashiwo TaxID=2829 RepID=A0A7S3XVT7_HETAK